MADGDDQYELKSVKVVRGTGGRAIKKWEAQGWELVEQSSHAFSTHLTLRRPRSRLLDKRRLAALGALAAVAVIGLGIGAVADDDPPSSAAPTASSTSVSEPASRGSETPMAGPPASPTTTQAERDAQVAAEKQRVADLKKKVDAEKEADAEKKAKAKKRAEAKKKADAKEAAEAREEAAEARADAKLTFGGCKALNQRYPHGVGKPGATDHSSGPKVTTFKHSEHVYELNSRSDRDGDGIACERR